ncbi:membrane protein [Lutibacter sp. B2]|nr:membrane protein [Lutibacter sp. B2]
MKINRKMMLVDVKKLPGLFVGFFLCAYGIAQMKVANIGMNSWGTLNLGIVNKFAIEFGRVTQIVGIFVILFSLTLKIYPGIGTILNMYFIGVFIDIIDKVNIIWIPEIYLLKVVSLFWGILIFNYGIYFYIKQELGAGPRDGLMVGLIKITGLSTTYVRPAIELTVLVIGYLLGGLVGIGTVLVTFCGGYILNEIFVCNGFDPKKTNQRKIYDYFIETKESM